MIQTVHWAGIYYTWFTFPLVLCTLIALMRRYSWQKKIAFALGKLHHFSWTKTVLKMIFLVVALIALMVAIARPQWDEREQKVVQEGRDVIIALDISRSMLAQDIKPNRLEFAKEKVKKIVEHLPAERLSLMVFSSAPLILCPFTQDTQAFLSFLSLVDVETVSSGSTALDKAIKKAIDVVAENKRKHTLMFVFTDGEDFSDNIKGLEEQAKQNGLRIFTVGVGTPEGAPIPLYDEHGALKGHQKDKAGSVVISRLNEPLLADLAQKTGAHYLRAIQDDSDIKQLKNDVNRFEKEKFDDRTFSVKQEQFVIFAFISFAAILLEWLL